MEETKTKKTATEAQTVDYEATAKSLEEFLTKVKDGIATRYNNITTSMATELNIATRYELRLKADILLSIYNEFFGNN